MVLYSCADGVMEVSIVAPQLAMRPEKKSNRQKMQQQQQQQKKINLEVSFNGKLSHTGEMFLC